MEKKEIIKDLDVQIRDTGLTIAQTILVSKEVSPAYKDLLKKYMGLQGERNRAMNDLIAEKDEVKQ